MVTLCISPAGQHLLPHWSSVIPFIVLLLLIATGPVLFRHFWEKHYPKFSIALGLLVCAYYLVFLGDSTSILHSLTEYISFIALLGSLFVATGGILVRVSEAGTPFVNTMFLLFGAVISNIIGTTGASMLLIRPFMKLNRHRVRPYQIIFFIFLVSNIGGALTPIGDPPLFLGFLRGVPFFWVIAHLWPMWLIAVGAVLAIFYFWDKRDARLHGSVNAIPQQKFTVEFKGKRNLVYLLIILISVFLDKNIISWVPSLSPLPFGIREIIMVGVMIAAYKTSDESALRANEFDFEPIKEVAFLFIGIFLTMIPALQLIAYESNVYHEYLHETSFYWATGILSAFLDNAPTYLNFLSAAMGKFGLDVNIPANVLQFVLEDAGYLVAISVAAVFFGAMSYIGNGPNFMVKSISERAGVKMPPFFSYMFFFSIPVLLPVLVLIWLLFFN